MSPQIHVDLGELEQTVAALVSVQNGLIKQIHALIENENQSRQQLVDQMKALAEAIPDPVVTPPRPDSFAVEIEKEDGERVSMQVTGRRPH